MRSSISHCDLIQFNWYKYAVKGHTAVQSIQYARSCRYYKQCVLATPKWCDLRQVWDMFLYARFCREEGTDMQTDHIVPINHAHVCGLHCPDNLQQLTAAENNVKSNKTWPNMWDEQLELVL